MPRKYTKTEGLNIKSNSWCQHLKMRLMANGYIPHPEGRVCKNAADEETCRQNELIELWMEVELKYRILERFRGKYGIEAMSESRKICFSDFPAHGVDPKRFKLLTSRMRTERSREGNSYC